MSSGLFFLLLTWHQDDDLQEELSSLLSSLFSFWHDMVWKILLLLLLSLSVPILSWLEKRGIEVSGEMKKSHFSTLFFFISISSFVMIVTLILFILVTVQNWGQEWMRRDKVLRALDVFSPLGFCSSCHVMSGRCVEEGREERHKKSANYSNNSYFFVSAGDEDESRTQVDLWHSMSSKASWWQHAIPSNSSYLLSPVNDVLITMVEEV